MSYQTQTVWRLTSECLTCGRPTCLWWRAACTEGRFSICCARRRFRALAMCCCCRLARMLTAAGCLLFSMFVKLGLGKSGWAERKTEREEEEEEERKRGRKGGRVVEGGFQIKSFHTHTQTHQGRSHGQTMASSVNAHFVSFVL